ncbi:MAG: DUF1990 family protein [Ilumatobacteraceae bacterium]
MVGWGCWLRQTRHVSIRLTRPSPAALQSLIDDGRSAPLTYEPVGMSAMDTAPPGYRLDRWSRSLGHGDLIFEKAADALRKWEVQKRSGLVVLAEGPPVVGLVVAMSAPLPIGFIDVVCRVVDVVEQGDRVGFTYGTLPVHPERGEESFTVVRAADGSITFEVAAASRPRQLLARAFSPIARKMQRSATGRYLDAMQSAAAT